MSRISVIVPVFNSELYLSECIESVRHQTFADWELILIDDGATDGSFELCKEFAAKDARIRVIKGIHGGVGAARNLGLESATGDFITFLDSDDWLDPDYFSAICIEMEHNVSVVISGLRRVPINVETCIECELCVPCNQISENDFINLIERNYISSAGATFFRRVSIGNLRFDTNVNMGEDLRFVFAVLQNTNGLFKAVPTAYYNYRMREGSLTDTINANKIYSLQKTYDCLFRECVLRDFSGGAYREFVSKRLLGDLYYLNHVLHNTDTGTQEKTEMQLGLAKINWLRKHSFNLPDCPLKSQFLLQLYLRWDLVGFEFGKKYTASRVRYKEDYSGERDDTQSNSLLLVWS